MNRLMMVITIAGFTAWFAGLPSTHFRVWADEPEKKDENVEKKVEEEKKEDTVKKAEAEARRAKILAETFKVPESTILDLRNQKLGWGEISHLLVIAQKSGQSIETILALKQSGMGWGKIAQKYNLKLGLINREVVGLTHKIDKAVNHGKSERMEKPASERREGVRSERDKFQRPSHSEMKEKGHRGR